jgi:3D (Asp-Asp-Asp) domain-containing protein
MSENKALSKTHLFKLAAIFAAVGFAYVSSDARALQRGKKIAKTTVYFVPHIKDYCPTTKICPKFRHQVRLQGSGTLSKNRALKYNGKIERLGTCDTAFGAAGICLKPYISIAADPRYYSMGDIIKMPSMKGRVMTLPNGKFMIHPGYFIVEDIGGAIKGPKRFDFFTGSAGMTHALNSFGTNGSKSTQLLDLNDRSARKSFTALPKGSRGNKKALAAIDKAMDEATRMRIVASKSRKSLISKN